MTLVDLDDLYTKCNKNIAGIDFNGKSWTLPDDFKKCYSNVAQNEAPDGYCKVTWSENCEADILTTAGMRLFVPAISFHVAKFLVPVYAAIRDYRSEVERVLAENNLSIHIFGPKYKGPKIDLESLIENSNNIPDIEKKQLKQFLLIDGWWNAGKSIDRTDYYVSPLLRVGNLQGATQPLVANIAKHLCEHTELYNSLNIVADGTVIVNKVAKQFVFDVIKRLFEEDDLLALLKHSGVGLSKDDSGSLLLRIAQEESDWTQSCVIPRLFIGCTAADFAKKDQTRWHCSPFYFNYEKCSEWYLSTQWCDDIGREEQYKNDSNRLRLSHFKNLVETQYPKFEIIVEEEHETADRLYKLIKRHTVSNVEKVSNQASVSQSDINSLGNFVNEINGVAAAAGLSFPPELLSRFICAALAKPFVILTGISGSGKTKLAQSFTAWLAGPGTTKKFPFEIGGTVPSAKAVYTITDIDRIGAVIAQPNGDQIVIPFAAIEEWVDYLSKNPSSLGKKTQDVSHDLKEDYPTKYCSAIHSFHPLLKAMAEQIMKKGEKYWSFTTSLLVPVGADWTNNEKLLGYPNALDSTKYVLPDSGVLKLMINARDNPDIPFFLILDEMNLSHVERYFADFLSAMESGDEIKLYDGSMRFADDGTKVPQRLKFPKNLFVIGTMNVDETTYMFSPKVLDRAQVIEFRVSKDDMSKYLSDPQPINLEAIAGKGVKYAKAFLRLKEKPLELNGGLTSNPTDGTLFDPEVEDKYMVLSKENKKEIEDALMQFFPELTELGAEFGYRTAGEIVRFCAYYINAGATIDQAIDASIVQKLLPKVHGSRRKLSEVLKTMWTFCLKPGKTSSLDDYIAKDSSIKIPDECAYTMSADKIARMYKAVLANGFASFAEA